jgi:hypothetical protein
MTQAMRTTAAVLTLTLALASACGSGGGDPASADEGTELQAAKDLVDWPQSQYVQVSDDGHTLIIDGDGNYKNPGADLGTITIVLAALDAPGSAVAKMSNTRALDGMQDATWGKYAATWTYHPDNGLDLIIEEEV